jgi:hypothetical protein
VDGIDPGDAADASHRKRAFFHQLVRGSW